MGELKPWQLMVMAVAWDVCPPEGRFLAEVAMRELLGRGDAARDAIQLGRAARAIGRPWGSPPSDLLTDVVCCMERCVSERFESFSDQHLEQLDQLGHSLERES